MEKSVAKPLQQLGFVHSQLPHHPKGAFGILGDTCFCHLKMYFHLVLGIGSHQLGDLWPSVLEHLPSWEEPLAPHHPEASPLVLEGCDAPVQTFLD